MLLLTAKYKLKPTRQHYEAMPFIRICCRDIRNACLQELIDSYRAACREAARHGRDRPNTDDWVVVRAEEIREFLAWQIDNEKVLRSRHDAKEIRRVDALKKDMAKGRLVDPAKLERKSWKAKTASDFGRSISEQDQRRRLAEIRDADPDGIGSIPLSISRNQVEIIHKAMKAFFRRVAKGEAPGFPRFKGYERIRSFSCPIGDGIQLRDGRLYAKMLWHGGLKVNMHRDLPGVPKTVRLKYDGRFWHVTFVCEVEHDASVEHARPGSVCGIDAGVNRLLTFDDGTFVENPNHAKFEQARIRRLGRALSRCKRGSHSRNKVKRSLAAVSRKVKNRRDTAYHKISKDVVTRFQRVFIEGLEISNMIFSASGTVAEPGTNVAQKRGLNRVMSHAAIATLYGMMDYKAASAGSKFVRVDPRNTSKDCSECGGREPDARRRDRYRCSCGADLNADHNAARNVLARGILAA